MIATNKTRTRRHPADVDPIAAFNETAELLLAIFYNSPRGENPFCGMITDDEFKFHLADGTTKGMGMIRASQQEVQFRINSRLCSVPAISSVKGVADCLRNFASDLMKAADEIEATAKKWRDSDAKRAAANGKAVAE